MKKNKIIIFCLIIVFTIFNVSFTAAENTILQDIKKLEEIFIKIQRQHISKPETPALIKNAIEGMIKTLDDPYTTYMQEKESDDFQERIKSHFGGVGIAIGTYNDTATGDTYLQINEILKVKNCPAAKAGLLAKDIILKIDEVDGKNLSFAEAKEHLRGPVGTEVTLTIRRLSVSETEPMLFKVIRDDIEFEQAYCTILSDSTGYLQLGTFTELSAKEVKEKLTTLIDSGAVGIIFDLRNNPGGLLTAAVDIVSLFIKGSKRVVYTKDRDEQLASDYYTNGNAICDLPLILLVNEHSASASEIVTGAFKAHKRAVIVGKKTFGKGSVQQMYPFNDKSSLKLTIAKYYTPSDICINKIGIEPDIDIANTEKADLQLEFAQKIMKAYYVLSRKMQSPL